MIVLQRNSKRGWYDLIVWCENRRIIKIPSKYCQYNYPKGYDIDYGNRTEYRFRKDYRHEGYVEVQEIPEHCKESFNKAYMEAAGITEFFKWRKNANV
jgi:hypothetical protein